MKTQVLRTMAAAGLTAILLLASSPAGAIPSAANSEKLGHNVMSPMLSNSGCQYKVQFGNYGSATFAKLRLYGGSCTGFFVRGIAKSSPTVGWNFGDSSTPWTGGTDGCGSYFEQLQVEGATSIGTGAQVIYAGGYTRTFRLDGQEGTVTGPTC